ncbi:LytR/AlgR family response regulator transcription factor [Ulvibacter antarcticus]|uniref:LytTR family two component transcriptional regulator n=1 Tax=Ulvibacter antarcticus TaxID=442714 RepID=A0A3L9YD72_9FLAO|nr:LytTR family DNA-binding domain-containing protein [Ulvibacter antarcticus]RMA58646.1 LytTR family two component transcriptional regulator [Ulvibacter antarcticus]
MNSKTAILVDDEFTALKGLQQKVEQIFPEITIVGAFQKPKEALKVIKQKNPDILFLDIQMPGMTGFELLSELDDLHFQVIFVTAYNEYALKAFKHSAVDYILKPVDNDELIHAVSKALEVINLKQQSESNAKLVHILSETFTDTNKIIVPTGKGLSFIPQQEVFHIEGYEGYTKFHLTNKSEILSSYNLGKFERSLSKIFFKCHKSHIINVEKVRSFENEGYLVLENDYRVPISKANRKVFLDLFN